MFLIVLSLWYILFIINIPKLLFKDNKLINNILFSSSSSIFFVLLIIPGFTFFVFLLLIISLGMLLFSAILIGLRFGEKNNTYIPKKIKKAIKTIKNPKERTFDRYGLILCFLLFAYIGSVLLMIFILTLSKFYFFIFIAVVAWKFLDLLMIYNKRKKLLKQGFTDAVIKADHLESNFYKFFIIQLFSLRGFIYSFLLFFTAGYAAVGSAIIILGSIGFITEQNTFLEVVNSLPYPQLMIIILPIYSIIFLISTVIFFFIPLHFNLKIIEFNIKRITKIDDKEVKILPKSLWSITLFLFYISFQNTLFTLSPETSSIISPLIPLINFGLILYVFTKLKKPEILTDKIEKKGVILLLLSFIILAISGYLFPITPWEDEWILAFSFIFFIFAFLFIMSIVMKSITGEKPFEEFKIKLKGRKKL